MPRKNPKAYTQMQIKRSTLRKLESLKSHPRQSYSELIEDMISKAKNKSGPVEGSEPSLPNTPLINVECESGRFK